MNWRRWTRAGTSGSGVKARNVAEEPERPRSRARVRRWRCTNPYFRKSVDDTKTLVYAAGVFRNILTHGYAEVDHRIVWEVATVKVPALAADVRALLEAAEGPDAI